MAKLKKCTTCGGEYSSNAYACPHCGDVKKKEGSSVFRLLFWIVAIAIITAIIIPKLNTQEEQESLSTNSNSTAQEKSPPVMTKEEEKKIENGKKKLVALLKKEKKVFGPNWESEHFLTVGMFDNGKRRDGFAQYICILKNKAGLDNYRVFVKILDAKRMMNSGDYKAIGKTVCMEQAPQAKESKETIVKKKAPNHKQAIQKKLHSIIKKLTKFNQFNAYKKLTLEGLKSRVETMRESGRILNLHEKEYKEEAPKLYIEAKKLQIYVQVKHYPKMRNMLGPLLRAKMWENDISVKTVGHRFTRIILTGGYFAANRNIKTVKDTLSIMLSDFRFKRIDFKWIRHAQEWTYFVLHTKKDNQL